jgi:UDP-N-acetylmuramoyl-L-alanyl-D-glutamate--2,6-diaminopimelate ligase
MIRVVTFEELVDRVHDRHIPIATHSGKVVESGIFVILPPPVSKGREEEAPGSEQYLADVLKARPGAIVCRPRHLPLLEALNADCEVALHEDTRTCLGVLAQKYYGTDKHCPTVIGITGTNGKTTGTYLLEALFTGLGRPCGVIGTVSYRWPGHEEDAPLTTPDCLTLHAMLAEMYKAGAEYAFMEVSSHAIDQNRIAGINYSGALMTNLTQDHLDYHADMEAYFAAKERLFLPVAEGGLPLDNKIAALNADDEYCRRLLARLPDSIGFSLEQKAVPGSRHLAGRVLAMSPRGLHLELSFEGQKWNLNSPLVGGFNVMNLLGAQALGLGLGLHPGDFAALSSFTGVSGRLERVQGNKGLHAFVDYAHTPDALVKAISALRDAGFARVITVFGCGGDRDRTKRPLMGKAVAGLTDIAVLTSDNPRSEDPEAIMADVLPGLEDCPFVITQPDRRAALAEAVALAGPEDALLVAGKGHETYQLIKGIKYPFSDQAVLRELMQ